MTDYIIGPRRSGKSTALIKKIVGTEGDILVLAPNYHMAKILEMDYKRYLLNNDITEVQSRTVLFKSTSSDSLPPMDGRYKIMIDEFTNCRRTSYFAKEDIIAVTITVYSNDTVCFLNGNFSDKTEIGDVSPWEKIQLENTRKKSDFFLSKPKP